MHIEYGISAFIITCLAWYLGTRTGFNKGYQVGFKAGLQQKMVSIREKQT